MSNKPSEYIYGTNAVLEAIRNKPEVVERVFLEKEKTHNPEILKIIAEKKIQKENFIGNDLGKDLKVVNHQGVLAKIYPEDLTVNFEYFIENLDISPDTCLIILGELEDPQNVGAIIRSATAFGVAGILIPEHNQVQVNGTIVKVSAGTAFSTPLVKIKNVNVAIEKLKEKRFWIYGLDMFGEKSIYEEKYTEASVFVIGNEGDGIREKTKEACDMLLSIPISEKCESLNASVSTAIAIAEWRRQRLFN